MAKHLIVYGHGAGDPGAVGNGTNERDFNRKILHPYLKKWADKSKDSFVFFDTTGSRDMFQETANGWGMHSISSSQYASVTEIHEDAASAAATGGHNIISSSFKADKNDLNLAETIRKIVNWWGGVANSKGISYRSDLLNLNVAAQRGINYRLMELGFITSKRDMDIIKRDLDKYSKGIIEGITGENLGGNTVDKKPDARYYQKEDNNSLFELLKDDYAYNSMDFNDKTRRRVLLKKGTRIYGRELRNYKGITRMHTAVGYVTSAKVNVKKVWQNDKWYK